MLQSIGPPSQGQQNIFSRDSADDVGDSGAALPAILILGAGRHGNTAST